MAASGYAGDTGVAAASSIDARAGMDTPPLLPRYCRILSFGGVLDETFRIFRTMWLATMVVLTISAVPNALISLLLGGVALNAIDLGSLDLQSGDPADLARLAPLFGRITSVSVLSGLVSLLLLLPSAAAITRLTDDAMRGRPPAAESAWRAYVGGLRHVPVLFGASVLSTAALMLLALLAIPLFVVGLFGVLGGLVGLIGLLVWWANPAARRNWLRWLIVLATPFGLPLYYGGRWSLALPAVVLERAGPLAALRRSAALTRPGWLRVFGAAFILALVAFILQSIPAALAQAALALLGISATAALDEAGRFQATTPIATVVNVAAGSLGWVAFGALPFIGTTLLFLDARNRREGADLAERIDRLDHLDQFDRPGQ